jgi:hypothetical protein
MTTAKNVLTVMAALAMGAVGCAHGTSTSDRGRAVRGGARVGPEARALVLGPAPVVHATGDKPVRWFVVDRVKGDDSDCAGPIASARGFESARARLSVTSGQVLCAMVARGATDVIWHELPEGEGSLWALR